MALEVEMKRIPSASSQPEAGASSSAQSSSQRNSRASPEPVVNHQMTHLNPRASQSGPSEHQSFRHRRSTATWIGVPTKLSWPPLVFFGALALAGLFALMFLMQSPDLIEGPELQVVPNDLWGIHDLLLVGYAAPFMKPGSEGQQKAREQAVMLAKKLKDWHPHAPCRAKIQRTINLAKDDKAVLVGVAQEALTCLPGKFTESFFRNAFTEEDLEDPKEAKEHRMPEPRLSDKFGVCRRTRWPRTCSLWASFHAMAYRADTLQEGSQLLQAISNLVAAGATQCGTCTKHFRLFQEPVVDAKIMADFDKTYCANEQCSAQADHVAVLMGCIEKSADFVDAEDCRKRKEELDDVRHYRAYVKEYVEKMAEGADPKAKYASVPLIALHNAVTLSIDTPFFPEGRGRYYCADRVLKTLPKLLPGIVEDGKVEWTGPELDLPGLGRHRFLNCSAPSDAQDNVRLEVV
eukprot:TRINITY_DN74914_c0_g1_i1.p1 TRINITY_DN74914_c0_g1~~TRINITY_DN74914_c0_g1_i1.p1  ORF type:complete len:462 (-),score=89.03 TRINITY_DN74914_c0_g1_i1:215-1600(-)